MENANHPPPAKLLQDWARTPLPHVCPYCGKTFTRRVFLRAHVFSHTGEKLFTCKVTVPPLFVCLFLNDSNLSVYRVSQKTNGMAQPENRTKIKH